MYLLLMWTTHPRQKSEPLFPGHKLAQTKNMPIVHVNKSPPCKNMPLVRPVKASPIKKMPNVGDINAGRRKELPDVWANKACRREEMQIVSNRNASKNYLIEYLNSTKPAMAKKDSQKHVNYLDKLLFISNLTIGSEASSNE